MSVGIVGLGNFGTAMANLIAGNGHPVLGWEHEPGVGQEINARHSNSKYLPGIQLDAALSATGDLPEVFRTSSVVLIAIPSVFLRSTLAPLQGQVKPDLILVNLAKGIEASTGLTSFQMLSSLFPDQPKIMLSGPSVANEFARGMPTTIVLASPDRDRLLAVSHLLDNAYFRTRFSDDVIGVELGGILKNIYAIGLGLFDGKSITSVNFRAAYLTLSLEEITRFGVAMGAKIETFLYLSGMGDLLATSLSGHSHNRQMGEYLAQGLALAQIKAKMGVVPEGFNTLQVVLYIAEKLHVSMPLAKGLWDVINGKLDADRFIASFIRDFVD